LVIGKAGAGCGSALISVFRRPTAGMEPAPLSPSCLVDIGVAMNNPCKALLGAALVLCGPALATPETGASRPAAHLRQVTQAPAQKDEPLLSSERTVNLTEENRYIIREIVLKDPNVRRETGTRAAIGDPSPPGIATQSFPTDVSQKVPALRSYKFFVMDGSVVIIDPKNNKVADIVKQTQ
jgi:hypothetical protein